MACPSIFCAGMLLLAANERVVGALVMWLALSGLGGYFAVRAWRVGIELTDPELVVRGLFRTHRLGWGDVAAARLEPMRTASPFRDQFPYVALALDLVDGRSMQFEACSASKPTSGLLAQVVDQINGRLEAA